VGAYPSWGRRRHPLSSAEIYTEANFPHWHDTTGARRQLEQVLLTAGGHAGTRKARFFRPKLALKISYFGYYRLKKDVLKIKEMCELLSIYSVQGC
jgi:hypothetical protein